MPAGKAFHANGVWSQAAWAQVLASSLTVTLVLNNLFNLGVLHLSLNAVHIACGCQEIGRHLSLDAHGYFPLPCQGFEKNK